MSEVIEYTPVKPRYGETRVSKEELLERVGAAFANERTRNTMLSRLGLFYQWCDDNGISRINRGIVQAYRNALTASGAAPATVNQSLVAIRCLTREALDQGVLNYAETHAICSVSGVRKAGTHTGNWLTMKQAQELCNAPDKGTITGIRDRAILALMIGAGLRRAELQNLEVRHFVERDGRRCLIDFIGKGNKVRSLAIKDWTADRVDEWLKLSGISSGKIFRRIYPGSERCGESPLSDSAITKLVKKYAAMIGVEKLAPHDLRRTFASLAEEGGANVRQIQRALGHASVATTERYLAATRSLRNPACDHLGMEME